GGLLGGGRRQARHDFFDRLAKALAAVERDRGFQVFGGVEEQEPSSTACEWSSAGWNSSAALSGSAGLRAVAERSGRARSRQVRFAHRPRGARWDRRPVQGHEIVLVQFGPG